MGEVKYDQYAWSPHGLRSNMHAMEQGKASKAEDIGLTSWLSLSLRVINAYCFPESKSMFLSKPQTPPLTLGFKGLLQTSGTHVCKSNSHLLHRTSSPSDVSVLKNCTNPCPTTPMMAQWGSVGHLGEQRRMSENLTLQELVGVGYSQRKMERAIWESLGARHRPDLLPDSGKGHQE